MKSKILIVSLSVGVLFLLLTNCQKETIPPEAYFTVFPSFGGSGTVFHFDARQTSDGELMDPGIKIRWDWEGDSVWDTPFSLEKQVARRFDTGGWYYVAMQVKDHSGYTAVYKDTFEVWASTPEVGELFDSRDGNKYKIAKFKNQWIMSENLRFGTWIQDTVMPIQNIGPEFYIYNNDYENMSFGGLYTWYESLNYRDIEGGQGICPDGWHIPTFTEWNDLIGFEHYIRGTPLVPINIDYYYGVGSLSGIDISFFGAGSVSYPLGGKLLNSSGLNSYVKYWTSDHLLSAYRGDSQRKYSFYIILNKISYGCAWGFVTFDPIYATGQRLDVAYIRCFKDSEL